MKTLYYLFFMTIFTFLSCEKFLDVKPDKKMATPNSLNDIEAMLNKVDEVNMNVIPDALEFSGDNYYLTKADWNAISTIEFRNSYLWNSSPLYSSTWNSPYGAIFYANTALDELESISTVTALEKERKDILRGRALFFRGYYFFKLALTFAPSYDLTNLDKLGIVLRLDSDINKISKRATVEETYNQVISDLHTAMELLPMTSSYKTQPNKLIAYSALAQVYLAMRDYHNAGLYALKSFEAYSDRLDFNTLSSDSAYPFARYNQDVLFYCSLTSNSFSALLKVDKDLLDSYHEDDLRKYCFFQKNKTEGYNFKGNYAQNNTTYFAGITIGEMQLILAETAARAGRLDDALYYLNDLLKYRYVTGALPKIHFVNELKALEYILEERRKELAFKGSRWADIRRLSKDVYENIDLKRVMDKEIAAKISVKSTFNYAHLIPESVMSNVEFSQNINN